jgi:hypothetical protein
MNNTNPTKTSEKNNERTQVLRKDKQKIYVVICETNDP